MRSSFAKFLFFVSFIFCACALQASDCTTVYLVRHGQTDWNLQERIQGSSDVPINETGKVQSLALAETLKCIPFNAVYTSGVLRANQTASILLAGKSLEIQKDHRFAERDFGIWEGKFKKEYEQASQEDKNVVEADPIVVKRAMEALTEIAAKHLGQTVLVVSHGGVVRNVVAHLEGVPSESIKPDNTSYAVLHFCDNKWHIKEMHGFHDR